MVLLYRIDYFRRICKWVSLKLKGMELVKIVEYSKSATTPRLWYSVSVSVAVARLESLNVLTQSEVDHGAV